MFEMFLPEVLPIAFRFVYIRSISKSNQVRKRVSARPSGHLLPGGGK